MWVFLGVAIMPTGQQLYSPTGFLPVPMSSPSGYATGNCLHKLINGAELWEAWGPEYYKSDYGAMCGCGNRVAQFPVKAGKPITLGIWVAGFPWEEWPQPGFNLLIPRHLSHLKAKYLYMSMLVVTNLCDVMLKVSQLPW